MSLGDIQRRIERAVSEFCACVKIYKKFEQTRFESIAMLLAVGSAKKELTVPSILERTMLANVDLDCQMNFLTVSYARLALLLVQAPVERSSQLNHDELELLTTVTSPRGGLN